MVVVVVVVISRCTDVSRESLSKIQQVQKTLFLETHPLPAVRGTHTLIKKTHLKNTAVRPKPMYKTRDAPISKGNIFPTISANNNQ